MTLLLVASCARGLEEVLREELTELGAQDIEVDRGAVRFSGSHETAYRVCYRSRVASRVLLKLRRFPVPNADALYGGVNSVRWTEHLTPKHTLRVDFVGNSESIRDHRFGAMKTKDAIVDRVRADAGDRPNIDVEQPDVRVRVHLRDGFATLLIDLSGAPLFQRGWRKDAGPAPLKETLAAGLLRLAGWPAVAAAGGHLVDPMCGSGTFLVEGAEMALGLAAGRHRSFGFERWVGHDERAWQHVRSEADVPLSRNVQVFGSDRDPAQVERARKHAEVAGLTSRITLRVGDLADAKPPRGNGILVTNPPYGERLEEVDQAGALMRQLGDVLRKEWMGWTAWILAGSPQLAKRVGLKPSEKHAIFNGALECRFVSVAIRDQAPVGQPAWRQREGKAD